MSTELTRQGWRFINQQGDFSLDNPGRFNDLYFPLANEAGMMASITPTLGGDSKTGQHTFLMTPVSAEDLHNSRSTRNFWVFIEGWGAWSATGNSVRQRAGLFGGDNEPVCMEAGFLWHRVTRENPETGIRAEIVNFVPTENDTVELMKVTLTNTGQNPLRITPTAAIPIYGRSADNIRDHRQVASLLHRIFTTDHGVLVRPTYCFDERGHRPNLTVYGIFGADGQGTAPVGFFPVAEEFIGSGGALDWPETVVKNTDNLVPPGCQLEGYEALGGLRFQELLLVPGGSKSFVIMSAIDPDGSRMDSWVCKYCRETSFDYYLRQNRTYWEKRLSGLAFASGNPDVDQWLKWVTLQPFLRRIYGCSFLPHHDYGKGGRGWRDLWQDCLALTLLDPAPVRALLLNNFAGVRIDGSNATIIGTQPGEFIADRNNISRVWMDHGVWPFFTTSFYIHQSGDFRFLLEEQTYFKDHQLCRSKIYDNSWNGNDGNILRRRDGEPYRGTILEHILVELLVQFFNVGGHHHTKLEDADWNDGMDMAATHGESVAFTAFYAYALRELGKILLELEAQTGIHHVEIGTEAAILLDSLYNSIDYGSGIAKKTLLDCYLEFSRLPVSGEKISVAVGDLARDLTAKADWIAGNIRRNEWITNHEGYQWINGYYNNDGQPVEGDSSRGVRMILTGQVFTILGGIVTDDQVAAIVRSVNRYLKDPELGGYRLNTNFQEVQMNLGRCFGYAYGHKENGSIFNHMAVIYAYALYHRGFVKDGYDVLKSIMDLSLDSQKSQIYPGLPEYFNERGRGMYHYLTGSASWLLLTLLTQVYGIKGTGGDLALEPKLVPEQFDSSGRTSAVTVFRGRKLEVCYHNPQRSDYGTYFIKRILMNGEPVAFNIQGNQVIIGKELLDTLDYGTHHLAITLG